MNVFEQVIRASNGQFFTVVFTKKDGTVRTLNGRIGVRKNLKNTGTVRASDDYITVYDVHAGGYRSVNKNTIRSITAMGVKVQSTR